uniref:SH2 domain-containing protein n=1 Tax=Anser cygnoides TaxID=8845 RepID=A0A8B9DR73_ANSCY
MKSAAEGARGRGGGGQGDVPKVPPPAPVPPAAPRRLSVTSAPPHPAVQLLRSPLPAPGGGATTGEAAALPHRQRPRPHTDPGSRPGLQGPGRWRDIGPMDDDRPLFSTFRPEDNAASTQPGNGATPLQPPRAEQPPEQRDAQGRAPPGWPPPGGGAQPELVALWARTRLWFEQTQARRLGAEGELPAWFHGFISRRETEQLLRDRPPGCFLVRFSESTVGFVLSYRGRERCRHFVLDQLPDGRYVILGERSAHAELAALLRHYAAAPVAPYREFLTVPCPRQDKPHGGVQPPGTSSPSPATPPAYSTVAKRPPGAGQAAGDGTEGGSGEVKARLGGGNGGASRAAAGCRDVVGVRTAPVHGDAAGVGMAQVPGAAPNPPFLSLSPRLPAPPRRSRPRWAPRQPPRGHAAGLGAEGQPPRVPTPRCSVKPSPPSRPRPSTSSSCASTPTRSPASARSQRSPSPSTPWAGAAAPLPRRTSTPRWRWPSGSCPPCSPGGRGAPSPRCPPRRGRPPSRRAAGSSAASPAKLPGGGSPRRLPPWAVGREEPPAHPWRCVSPPSHHGGAGSQAPGGIAWGRALQPSLPPRLRHHLTGGGGFPPRPIPRPQGTPRWSLMTPFTARGRAAPRDLQPPRGRRGRRTFTSSFPESGPEARR